MAIETINNCVNIKRDDGEYDHVHAPEIRTFDTTDEAVEILECKFLRMALDASDAGAVVVYKTDDGKYRCAFQRNQEQTALDTFESLDGVRAWLGVHHGQIFAAPASTALN